jgi:peptidyl-prolyl cis-trans isomerase B (cyclophilin B)
MIVTLCLAVLAVSPGAPRAPAARQAAAARQAVVETSAGVFVIDLTPETAPNYVAHFVTLAGQGAYDGMAFHRVVPGFVIQTGALASRTAPLTERQQALQPEFNDTVHVKGIVSMARGDDPASATTSFFICTGASAALDSHYTAFGRVVDGMAAVETIEAAPRNGETPTTRVELRTVRVEHVP